MREKNKKPYSHPQYFLWLIAGSEISVLRKCPNEFNRHANIGLMILITSLFTGITSFVAGKTFAKESTWGVLGFSFVWAFLIFSLDRSMVNSIKKDLNNNRKSIWSYFWPRLVLAIILAFFMSIPLDHIVFKERIDYQLSKNSNDDWRARTKDLESGYNIARDSFNFKRFDKESQGLGDKINERCENCPAGEYKVAKQDADVKESELPSLLNAKKRSENDYNTHLQQLRVNQTPLGEDLIDMRSLIRDDRLRTLARNRSNAQRKYRNMNDEIRNLNLKANEACAKWREEMRLQKRQTDSLKNNTRARLDSNTKVIASESSAYKNMLEEMQGFDTKFVTLFLMPNWGVQVLKWLIFLALLVIEILPTYLKIRTPISQYDWEMQTRDSETEIESRAKIENLQTGIKDIEDYRTKNEVELNKRLIDKLVVIEEKLANEMLDDWEVKARSQMKKDVDNS
jgi:hypothetical protein